MKHNTFWQVAGVVISTAFLFTAGVPTAMARSAGQEPDAETQQPSTLPPASSFAPQDEKDLAMCDVRDGKCEPRTLVVSSRDPATILLVGLGTGRMWRIEAQLSTGVTACVYLGAARVQTEKGCASIDSFSSTLAIHISREESWSPKRLFKRAPSEENAGALGSAISMRYRDDPRWVAISATRIASPTAGAGPESGPETEQSPFPIVVELQAKRWYAEVGGFYGVSWTGDEELVTNTKENPEEEGKVMVQIVRRRQNATARPESGVLATIFRSTMPNIGYSFGLAANSDRAPSYYVGLTWRALHVGKQAVAVLTGGGALVQRREYPGLEDGNWVQTNSEALKGEIRYKFNWGVAIGFSFAFGPGKS